MEAIGENALRCCYFISPFQAVGVSAVTGSGVEEFFTAVDEAAEEYEK